MLFLLFFIYANYSVTQPGLWLGLAWLGCDNNIKENIPENAKNRLYEANYLPMALKILDKTYGDKRLITQKLKSKMKNIKPVSKEPHEIIIVIHEQYDFLVKRLAKLSEKGLMETDMEYLNSIYLKTS